MDWRGTSDGEGRYTIVGLPYGQYKVWAGHLTASFDNPAFREEYYQEKGDWGSADMVTISANSSGATGIDFSLDAPGSISGNVTDENGQPIANLHVFATDYQTNWWVAGANTDAAGQYTLTGLPTGNYRVRAAPSNNGLPYADEFYNDTFDYNKAAQVVVNQPGDTPNIDFVLAPGGSISGTVREQATGQPLADVSVEAVPAGGKGGWGARTDQNGNYAIAGLPFGEYKVYSPSGGRWGGGDDGYIREYYVNKPDWKSADVVTISAGSPNVVGIDFSLEVGGSISGLVTNEAGQPIANLHVYATDFQTNNWMAGLNTGPDGTYVLRGLPAGSYRIRAVPSNNALPYADEYYNDTYSYNNAAQIPVGPPADTPNIDFVLAAAGTISGTVTNEQGQPVANLHVYATDYQTGLWMAGVNTDATGAYILKGLPAGSYRVRAYPANTGLPYLDEYYNDTRDYNQAAQVPVTPPGDTPDIDFVLAQGGSISGTVTNEQGQPLADVPVYAVDYATGKGKWSRNTLGDGTYVITGLASGTYRVAVWIPAGMPYAGEYFNDTYDYNQAAQVPVTAPGDTPNIDFVLAPGGSISGTVRDQAAGQTLANVSLDITRVDGPGGWGATTDQNGNYSAGGLPYGQYKIRSPASGRWGSGDDGYVSEYYNSKPDWPGADLVTISAGSSNVTGIDFTLEVGGSISGHVYASGSGAPVKGVWVGVSVFDAQMLKPVNWSTNTDENGFYRVPGIPSENYRVQTFMSGYVQQFYGDGYDWKQSASIPVAAPGETTNINFTLDLGGTISGTVKDQTTGQPLANLSVEVTRTDGPGGWGATTDASGNYKANGLPFGQYRVSSPAGGRWGANDDNYIREYFNNKGDQNSADIVTVSAAAPSPSGIDFALEKGGSISGHVYDAATLAPIGGASMLLFAGPSPYHVVASTGADATGLYKLPGLPPGQYLLRSLASDYVVQYHKGEGSIDEADAITVASGSPVVIDFKLVYGAGSISGVVYQGNTTVPAPNATVMAYTATTGFRVAGARTDSAGKYKITSLPPGEYKVQAASGDLSEWYLNETSIDRATPVAVSSLADTPNVNFTLGGISWEVRLTASATASGGLTDPDNFAGVAQDAGAGYDVNDAFNAPPPPPPFLDLLFPHPDWPAPYDGDYARDIRPPADSIVWLLQVMNVGFAGDVTITWDISQVPGSYQSVLLKDPVSDMTTNMRSTDHYTYAATAGSVRQFELRVAQKVLLTTSFPAGWNMFSLPLDLDPLDWGTQLGDDISPLYVYHYDAVTHGYQMYPPTVFAAQRGWGYWLKALAATDVDIEGTVAAGTPFSIHLLPGWMQIGHPFDFPVSWGAVQVRNTATGEVVSIEQAHANGWVMKYLYSYDPGIGGYRMETAPEGVLTPWLGYWVKALVEADLIVPATPVTPG